MEKEFITLKLKDIHPYPNNPRINDAAVEDVAESIRQSGNLDPIEIDEDNVILSGHTRLKALKKLGYTETECIRYTGLTEEKKKKYRLLANKTGEKALWDNSLLEQELFGMEFDGYDFGFDLDFEVQEQESPYAQGGDNGSLQRDFLAPPFSVLDGRQGYWLQRKKQWRELIEDNAETREGKLFASNINMAGSSSLLDPVLSEIVVKWFTPGEQSKLFDCFAGDTVFGYVSGYLGHTFTGIELRQEQVDANNERTQAFDCEYICDDGRNVCNHIAAGTQDLLFSCPPYYDLEVYSDLPNDASNQESYEDFYQIIDTAFTNAINCLADNRFAVIVVANIRDQKGAYYNFVGDIINTFTRNGMILYNDMVLLDPIGSATIRARRQFRNRKTVKIHQNVLVFYKGNPEQIKRTFKEVEVLIDESADAQLEEVD